MAADAAVRLPPAARFLPGRWFYGWYIAAACAVLMFVGVGVGYYGLPIFMKPLREDHGWTTAQVSWAPFCYFAFAGVTAFLTGPLIDRSGPLRFMLIGTLINGVSGAAIGFVNELWQLYAVYIVFAVAYGMSSGVATQAIMTRWFVRKRALATSISSTGVSMGGIVIAPLAAYLIGVGGLELATPVLAALVVVAGLPVILGVLSWDPAEMGLHPDGDATPVAQTAFAATQLRKWSRREAMGTVSFWALLIAFLMVLIAQTGYIIHQVSFLEDRFGSRNEAAFTISVTAAGSVIARLAVGIFADGVDRRLLAAALFVIQGSCVLLILLTENVLATWALTLVFGFTIGNVYMMQSLLAGELFGMVSFGSIFGILSFAGQTGSSIGPLLVGLLHDSSGSYTLPFVVTALITYGAAFVVLFAKPLAGVQQISEAEPGVAVPAAGGR